jgi:hypothetical protein
VPYKRVRYGDFNPLRFSMPPPVKKAVPEEQRQSMIARTAYFLAERRNFEPGHELEDWLAAEGEVDRRLAQDFRLRKDP